MWGQGFWYRRPFLHLIRFFPMRRIVQNPAWTHSIWFKIMFDTKFEYKVSNVKARVACRFELLKYNRIKPFLLSTNFKQHSCMYSVFLIGQVCRAHDLIMSCAQHSISCGRHTYLVRTTKYVVCTTQYLVRTTEYVVRTR